MLTPRLYESSQGEHDGLVGDATLRLVVYWGLLVGPTLVCAVVVESWLGVDPTEAFDSIGAKVLVGVWAAWLAHQWFSARASILMADERDGAIGILKVVATAFFVMCAWQVIRDGQFGDLKVLAVIVEVMFLVFAALHASLCIGTWTPIPTFDVIVLLVSASTTAAAIALT